MALDLSPGALVNAASSVPLVALGLWVLSLKPRRRATLALGVYSTAFGLIWIPNNLVPSEDALWLQAWFFALFILLFLVAIVALVVVGLEFPGRFAPAQRRLVVAAAGVAGSYTVVAWGSVAAAGVDPLVGLIFLAFAALFGATIFVLLLLSLRFPLAPTLRERRQVALMAAALGLFPALSGAENVFFVPGFLVFAGLLVAATLGLAALWLRHAARAAGSDARLARNVALALLGAALVGALGRALWGDYVTGAGGPEFGLSRMLGVLVLAYAILRHQLLGIDVKVKWTIRQSTIAAAFIGVFFVVSEGAQQLFSEASGPFLGIAAAGALVFAMAPLQRVAERVASAAVPGAGTREQLSAEERRAAYAEAARLLWKDGTLTVKERHALDGLRAQLGLAGEEARRIEREVTEQLEREGFPVPRSRARR